LIGLLLLSIAGKVATNTEDQPAVIAERTFASSVVQKLSERGFRTVVKHWPTGVVVHARREKCRLWVRDYTPHGTMRNVYEELAAPLGSIRYTYMGRTAKEPPKLDPLLRFFFHREMLRLGVSAPRYPIYAVASSAGCRIWSFEWPVSIG
jgi:hypothetical protein